MNLTEQAIGIRFMSKGLLQQALTHRSYLNEHPEYEGTDYEKLEYLGDAFLGWVIARELFTRYPSYSEGDLTRARSLLVRGTKLASIMKDRGMESFIIMGSGEESSGGRKRASILAAVMESLIGAVLIDRGEPIARDFILRWLETDIINIVKRSNLRDAKSLLQELCQRNAMPLPIYDMVGESGSSHEKEYRVRVVISGVEKGRGNGRRKVDAEQAAAEIALERMQNAL